jgi:hypothetical protein
MGLKKRLESLSCCFEGGGRRVNFENPKMRGADMATKKNVNQQGVAGSEPEKVGQSDKSTIVAELLKAFHGAAAVKDFAALAALSKELRSHGIVTADQDKSTPRELATSPDGSKRCPACDQKISVDSTTFIIQRDDYPRGPNGEPVRHSTADKAAMERFKRAQAEFVRIYFGEAAETPALPEANEAAAPSEPAPPESGADAKPD